LPRRRDSVARMSTSDPLRIANLSFSSRLFVGTGKYKDVDETRAALEASGAEVVTVALRRVNLAERGEGSMMSLVTSKRWTILPNTAGCYTAEEAVRTLRLARELGIAEIVKLEVIGDKDTLYPDNEQTLEAARTLVKEGFTVLPYCMDDPIICRKLEDAGCAAVMPLAAPIGSGLGIRNPHNLSIILERAQVPVIVDAGVAGAREPLLMASAMRKAVEAGREAFLAGRVTPKRYASASSPVSGLI
jgi:thiazole synthase